MKFWDMNGELTDTKDILWKLLEATTESVDTMASSLQRNWASIQILHLWLKFLSFLLSFLLSFFLSFLVRPINWNCRGFFCTWSKSDTTHSVRILRKKDRPVAELVTWQNIPLVRDRKLPPPRKIRKHNPSKRGAVDSRLRPRGHWDRPKMSRRRKNQDFFSMCLHECVFHLQVLLFRVPKATRNECTYITGYSSR
jgi:hypothetical protein